MAKKLLIRHILGGNRFKYKLVIDGSWLLLFVLLFIWYILCISIFLYIVSLLCFLHIFKIPGKYFFWGYEFVYREVNNVNLETWQFAYVTRLCTWYYVHKYENVTVWPWYYVLMWICAYITIWHNVLMC